MNNPDLQTLFTSMLNLTKAVLPKSSFLPTAATMDRNGEITLHAVPFDNQQASSMMAGILRKESETGQLRASGMMLDVKFAPPDGSGVSDAIVFILEHENGDAVLLHQTYRWGFFRKLKLGEQFEEPLPAQRRSWTSA
jgi:hypothetical protein